jgi:hypothetical protein
MGIPTSPTSDNPNGYIAIVFTYNGASLSYTEFLKTFYVTLPGGKGVEIGNRQFYGYAAGTANTITLGESYPLSSAASLIHRLLPTNAADSSSLQAAFENGAKNQAAAPGQTMDDPSRPRNLADITNIDWFSFPITLKAWYYDFSTPESTTLTDTSSKKKTEEMGGDGSSIFNALQITAERRFWMGGR